MSCKGNGDTYEAVNKSNERKKGKKKLKTFLKKITCVCGINMVVFSRMKQQCIFFKMHLSGYAYKL